MPGDRAPFRKAEFSDEAAAAAYRNAHDLRGMYTRENTERRRIGAHTLRRYLTGPQDRALTARMTKLRDAFEVANNDDIVLAYCQELIAAGKEAELAPALVEAAKKAALRRRA